MQIYKYLFMLFSLVAILNGAPTIINGDFEEGGSGDIYGWNGGPAWFAHTYPGYHGTRYAYMHTNNNPKPLTQTIAISPNTKYTVKFVAASGWSGYYRQRISIYDNTGVQDSVAIKNIANNTGLIEYQLSITSGANANKLTIKIDAGGGWNKFIKFDYFRIYEEKKKCPDGWTENDGGCIKIKVNKNFDLIFGGEGYNVFGDFAATGNSILDGNNTEENFASSKPKYINSDISVSKKGSKSKHTYNSSSAKLTLPPYVKREHIVWAGLFWQGEVHLTNLDSLCKVDCQTKGWNSVHLKTPNGKIFKITASLNSNNKDHTTYYYSHYREGDLRHFYSAYVNITDIVKNKSGYDKDHNIFTVGNIMVSDGKDVGGWLYFSHINEPQGQWYNGVRMGYFGGWSLIVVYDLNNEDDLSLITSDIKYKNIAIYNGYDEFLTWGGRYRDVSFETTINIKGFKTPRNGEVNSKVLFFGGGGDYGMRHDTLQIQNKKSDNFKDLKNTYNDGDQKFNGTYTYFNDLIIKDKEYFQGMDLDIFDISDMMDNNQNSTKIKFGVVYDHKKRYCDQVFPQVIAFSTELYTPKLCYDYDIKVGEYIDVSDNNREFKINKIEDKPLLVKVMIRSEESDFDIEHSKMFLSFNPDDVFSFNSAKVSLPNTYIYNDVDAIDKKIGLIPIGDSLSKDGGTISALDTIYTKNYFDFKKEYFNGKFDINIEGDITFDGTNYNHYRFSTALPKEAKGHLSKCDTNVVYDPLYGIFNVERGDSKFTQPEPERYSLRTQVAGVPYDISVASYKKGKDGKYNIANKINATVEVELINAGTYDNNSSAGYDSICQDPDSLARGAFVKFKNSDREIIKIPKQYSTYPSDIALKNAIFRVWMLVRKVGNDRVLVKHDCNSQTDSKCFDNLYKKIYLNGDDKKNKYCKSSCSNSSGSSCYDCLRKYYSMPVCSRDNFAIRPESFYIQLNDNNETYSNRKFKVSDNLRDNNAHIASGYLYSLNINATIHNSTKNVTNYFLNVVGDQDSKKALAIFNDSAYCVDKDNKDLKISILNGTTNSHERKEKNITKLYENGYIATNTGEYLLHIEDSEWTAIDQKDNPYKPYKDIEDCIKNSSDSNAGDANGKRGCSIQSNSGSYKDLKVESHPYKFDVANVNFYSSPNSYQTNYLYINNLNSNLDKIKNGSVMGINIKGNIVAKGKDGKNLTNYVNKCSAKDLDIDLTYRLSPNNVVDQKGNNVKLNYVLYQDPITSSIDIKNSSSSPIKYNFYKKYFSSPAIGKFNSYINFNRTYNSPINPFIGLFSNFEVTSPNDKMSVDLKQNVIPKGVKDLNSSRVFYYAKAKSNSSFYDDIVDNKVNTPIEVTVFCNESLEECQKYGIDTSKARTNEFDWWLSLEHNATAKEGDVRLQTNNSEALIEPTIIENFINGIDKDVLVKYDSSSSRPIIIKVKPTQAMINESPWLLYNKSQNTPPNYLYRVRFVDRPAAWSGKGKTGHTINVNSSGKKSNKVDW